MTSSSSILIIIALDGQLKYYKLITKLAFTVCHFCSQLKLILQKTRNEILPMIRSDFDQPFLLKSFSLPEEKERKIQKNVYRILKSELKKVRVI